MTRSFLNICALLFIAVLLVTGAFTSLHVQAQAPVAPVSFEVASIKPSKTTDGSDFEGCYNKEKAAAIPELAAIPKGRCIFRNASLRLIIAYVYDIPVFRLDELISGGPDWIRSDRYDIEAKADDESATESDLKSMTQTLLADRFKLAIHETTRDTSGYTLVVDKNGPKLRTSDGSGVPGIAGNLEGITAYNASMARLARMLSNKLHQPVEDKTGINGNYDFKLTFRADDNDAGPSIFTALQEQLGLKLESHKVPTRVLVVDHAEKPTGT